MRTLSFRRLRARAFGFHQGDLMNPVQLVAPMLFGYSTIIQALHVSLLHRDRLLAWYAFPAHAATPHTNHHSTLTHPPANPSLPLADLPPPPHGIPTPNHPVEAPTLPQSCLTQPHPARGPTPPLPTRRRRLAERILDSQDGFEVVFFASVRSSSSSVLVFARFARGSRPDRQTVFRRWFGGGARGCSEGSGSVMKFIVRTFSTV